MSGTSKADARDKALSMLCAVNDSSALVRSLYFTYLLILSYIGLTIVSTTDEQLLLVSPVTLPLLNVDLPIVDFYFLVPWLFTLIHFYLLLQLFLLARRVHLFKAAVEQVDDQAFQLEQRAVLFPFPFVHMLAGGNSAILRLVYATLVWTSLVWVPILLVLASQVAFLPYHDLFVTGSARMAVLVELLILWFFWPLILNRDAAEVRQWWRKGLSLPVYWYRWIVNLVTRRKTGVVESRPNGFLSLVLTTLIVVIFSRGVAVLPGEAANTVTFFRFAIPERSQANPLTHYLFDSPNAPFHRNLDLGSLLLIANTPGTREKNILRQTRSVERPAVLDAVEGLDLRGRDLRYANFYGSVLVNADLRGANLRGADFRNAFLDNVDMRPLEISPGAACVTDAQKRDSGDLSTTNDLHLLMEDTHVCLTAAESAVFSKAFMVNARADEALLRASDFSGADLSYMILSGADLRNTRFRRAELADVDFTGADIRKIRVSGAAPATATNRPRVSFDNHDLSGATISSVRLDGAVITKATSAAFYNVTMQRAKFTGADLRGTKFATSDLRLANFDGANLQGAVFDGTDLRGASFQEAQGEWSSFSNVKACMATFSDANLAGSNWYDVALMGSDLSGVDWRFVQLNMVRARAVSLNRAAIRPYSLYALGLTYSDVRNLRGADSQYVGVLLEIRETLRNVRQTFADSQDKAYNGLVIGRLKDDRSSHPGYFSEAALLCDDTSRSLAGLEGRCIVDDRSIEYLESALEAACQDANVLNGLVNIVGIPRELRSTRGGDRLPPGPERDFYTVLSTGLAGCPAESQIGEAARSKLESIREILEERLPQTSQREPEIPEFECD